MARPREYDDDLRIRLIEAAARLLADEGRMAVTTRRVAAEVGTSTSAIYTLIGSKDDLMRAICMEGFRRLADHLTAVDPTDDPVEDLRRLGDAYVDMAFESPDLYRVMFGEHSQDANLSDDEAVFALSTLQVLIDAVQRCVDAGAFHGEANSLAMQLWALGHGIVSLAIGGLIASNEEARACYEQAVVTFGQGLGVAPAPAPAR